MFTDTPAIIEFCVVMIAFFVVIVGRFFLVAGLFHLYFYVLAKESWQQRRISKKQHDPGQIRKELGWSMLSAGIFSLAGTLTYFAWKAGWTKLYVGDEQPWWWLPISLLIVFFVHETYYYWIHRWMHRPSVFRLVHKVHHNSRITSPWTAFSFHPLEATLQALILPVMIVIIPLHLFALLFVLVVMSLSSVINHLDIEIYPEWFMRWRPTKWLIGATHHSHHHKQYKYNFGLYFTFWDRWGGTEAGKSQKSNLKSQNPGVQNF